MLVGFTRKVSKQVQGTHFCEVTLAIPLREKLMVGYWMGAMAQLM